MQNQVGKEVSSRHGRNQSEQFEPNGPVPLDSTQFGPTFFDSKLIVEEREKGPSHPILPLLPNFGKLGVGERAKKGEGFCRLASQIKEGNEKICFTLFSPTFFPLEPEIGQKFKKEIM